MTHSDQITVTVTLSKATVHKLKLLEKQTGISRRAHIRRAVTGYLNRQEKKHDIAAISRGYRQMGDINLKLANDYPGTGPDDNTSI